MVKPNSRRAFLFGRRTPPTAWGQFCARLARTPEGPVHWNQDAARPQAWLRPRREADIFHARALCAEYGVCLALAGTALPEGPMPRGMLWAEPGADWAALSPGHDGAGDWRADGGCLVGALQEAGVAALDGADSAQSVAGWLASPDAANWAPGEGWRSGIERVEVVLSDGTVATLGPFGTGARDPLDSLTLQRMVPRLFELAGSEPAARWAREPWWPAKLRLDVLNPQQGIDVNLAWLLAGHGGCLAWVRAVWFSGKANPAQCGAAPIAPAGPQALDAARTLDEEIKRIVDPRGLFPPCP